MIRGSGSSSRHFQESGSLASAYPGVLYDLLMDARLTEYFNPLKSVLHVSSLEELKALSEEDCSAIGMSKSEMRRLKASTLNKLKRLLGGSGGVGVVDL
ncbi:Tyrosineprotein kinase PR2like, partial [Caligus rogercresseyi]